MERERGETKAVVDEGGGGGGVESDTVAFHVSSKVDATC